MNLRFTPSLLMTILFTVPAFSQTWKVTRTAWTDADEVEYSRFVQAVGTAREMGLCGTTAECIKKAPGNFLRTPEDANINVHVDCADLPYALRAYFAMKKGLPFSYVSGVSAAPHPEGKELPVRDIRYSSFGNRVSARKDIVSGSQSFNSAARNIMNTISSAMFRVHPDYDSATRPSDFYSVDIRKAKEGDIRGIRPGTIIYDPNGHVAVVYKIGKSGRIFFIDAHPDNSLTRGSYGMKFARSRPHAGAGFKNFRPLKVAGGKAVLATNREIADFSTVQFFGTRPDPAGSWSKGKFQLGGEELEYYDYVRAIMADGNVTVDPLVEVTEMTDALCLDAKDRVRAVGDAVKKGLHKKAHPSRLPYNIYGTSGEWEEYSTPSRDARLKTSFKELHDNALRWLSMHSQGSSRVAYRGNNLKGDMLAAYQKVVNGCRLGYTNSVGTRVSFTLNDMVDKMWDLSFSPYHCPELRWGGIGGVNSACNDSDKMNWYRAQQKLRNQIERTYETRMNYSASELLSGEGRRLGTDVPPPVDIRRALR